MSEGDRAGDRETESDSLGGVETLLGTGEGLEQGRDLLSGDAGACVGDLEYRAVGLLDRADSDPATRVVVAHGIVDEVGDHALEQHAIAAGQCGLERGVDRDLVLIDRRLRTVERVLGSGGEINRFLGCRSHLADGERQERLDGGFGPLDGSVDSGRHRLQLLGRPVRLGERDLDRGSHRRERRAQLVRRVGDESLLTGERGIEPLEHHVEGVGQLLELVIGAGERETLTEPQLGSPLRDLGDRPHRPQRPP